MHMYKNSVSGFRSICCAVLGAAITIGLAGCSEKARNATSSTGPETTAETNAPALSLDDQFAAAITTDPLPGTAPQLFFEVLNSKIASEGRTPARIFYREHYARSPEMAQAGFEAIAGSFGDTNSYPEFLNWADELLALSLHESLDSRVFANKLEVLVMLGQTETAQDQLLSALQEESARGDVGMGAVARALSQTSSNEVVLAWTQRLIDSDLRSDYRARALGWNVGTHLRSGAVEPVLERLPKCVELLPETELEQLLGGVFQIWSQRALHAQVDQALTTVKATLKEGHGLSDFLFTEEVKARVASDRWDDASTLFRASAAERSSDARQTAFHSLKSAAVTATNWPALETLSADVMERLKDDTRLRDDAVAAWIQSAREQEQFDALATRITTALTLEVNTRVLMQEYAASLYAVMSGTQNKALSELMQLGDRVKAVLTEKGDLDHLSSLMFDSAFILEDYDRVIAVLDAGLPGKDEDWHGMAKNKILAHKAMKEGDFKAAADRFRDFMTFVDKTWERPEADPSTGVMHTREMALGFNARRIADLLNKAGETLQAETTYRESLSYYETALATAKEGSKEHDLVSTAISELKQAMGPNEK